MYRARPDKWAEIKLGIDLDMQRDRTELEDFLHRKPDGEHQWCRGQLKKGKLFDDGESYQRKALRKLAKPGKYLWQWANGTGKTAAEAAAVLWAIDCWPDMEVLTTAGTWYQIKDQLWREIAHWYNNAPGKQDMVIDKVNKTGIHVGDKWMASGRASNKADTFEGVHSRRVMVLFDEAKAIPDEIWEAARRILRGKDTIVWWIAGSTPASPTGKFWENSMSDDWDVTQVSAYESDRIGLDEIQTDLEEIGENSPLFISMNLGLFPQEGDRTVLPLSKVLSIVDNREARDRAISMDYPLMGGLDVARYGNDETCLAAVRGAAVENVKAWRGASVGDTGTRAYNLLTEWGVQPGNVRVDVGYAPGVVDTLEEYGMEPIAINNGTPSIQNDRYRDWITEAWFTYRDFWISEGLASIPNDKKLIDQLASRKYEFTSKGIIRLEPKSKITGGKSPDRAESLMYATGPVSTTQDEPRIEVPSLEEMGEISF